MGTLNIPWKAWVLVSDGAKALLLENRGDAAALDLHTLDVRLHAAPPSRDLGTDRPGRVHESHGVSRSATEAGDLHEAEEVAFLKEVAVSLAEAVEAEGVKHLVLVAPPRALGVLRHHLPPAVAAKVSGELAKDLTKLPVGELEQHLKA